MASERIVPVDRGKGPGRGGHGGHGGGVRDRRHFSCTGTASGCNRRGTTKAETRNQGDIQLLLSLACGLWSVFPWTEGHRQLEQ